jgi:hypothetical protein
LEEDEKRAGESDGREHGREGSEVMRVLKRRRRGGRGTIFSRVERRGATAARHDHHWLGE